MNKKTMKTIIMKEDSLDKIQQYVLENYQKDTGSEMFKLFFSVMELSKEIRTTCALENHTKDAKIADIFLTLISICNNLGINLFNALQNKENSSF